MDQEVCGEAAYKSDIYNEWNSKSSSLCLAPLSNHSAIDAEKAAESERVDVQQGLSGDILVPDDSNIIDWDGPDDIQNPQNWGNNRKWSIVILASIVTFNQAMSSTIFAPGIPQAMDEFHSTNVSLSPLLISIYSIGLAVGPLFLSPLSEIYGRTPLTHTSNLLFLLSAILCAVSVNMPMLLVFRLVMGASNTPLGGAYVADLMSPQQRGRAMNVWTVGPVLAPVLGPIAGGFISLKTSWRWTFALVAIGGAIISLICLVILPETFAPRLLEIKAQRLRRQTGNVALRSKFDKDLTPAQIIRLALIRPVKMLIRSPTVVIVSLFLAVGYAYMYLMFSTFSDVFTTTYGFNPGEVGLTYIGIGAGSLIGQYGLDFFSKRHIMKQLAKNREVRPEDHLPSLTFAGIFMSSGLLCYGWSLEYRVHWIVPIIGTGFCGIAISLFFLAVQTYLVEAYTIYAASAIAASTVVRCVFGLTIPLAGPLLYKSLGYGWGNTLLGFLSLTVSPASIWLLRNGEQIRKNPRFTPNL